MKLKSFTAAATRQIAAVVEERPAVDPDLDVAYGFRKKDGRMALYQIALDGSLREPPVFARDDVDVDQVVRMGRRQRGVGVSYATDYRSVHFIDPAIERLLGAISRALPADIDGEIVRPAVQAVAHKVLAYIQEHGLYRAGEPESTTRGSNP